MVGKGSGNFMIFLGTFSVLNLTTLRKVDFPNTRVLDTWPQTSRMRMENFVAFVLILSLVAIATSSHATSPTSIVVPRSPASPTATTSSTEASEFKDPRTPTFFESQFFTGIRFWVKWSTKLVPKVRKIQLFTCILNVL